MMATETELVDLLESIADRAPTAQRTLDRLALTTSRPAGPSRRWLPIGAAMGAVAATVLAAVVVGGDASQRDTGTASSGPMVDSATYPLPLDGYYASATQFRTLQRATFVLAQRCAQTRGVTVPTADIPAGDPAVEFLAQVANDVRPLTTQQARTIGYDLYPSGTSAVDGATKGLTPQQLEIFRGWIKGTGVPKPTDPFLLDGGCYAQAEQTLLADAAPAHVPGLTHSNGLPGLFDDDMNVENTYLSKAHVSQTAPAMRQPEQRWSACMAAHGYPGLSTTVDAIQGAYPHPLAATAKRQAAQDVQCKQSTGFTSAWVAATIAAQRSVMAGHEAQLAQFRTRLWIRLANADAALR